jgi:hypothetical protein
MSDGGPDQPRTWQLERTAPVRADADGIFVPTDDLPGAAIGDTVVATGHDGGESRSGEIAHETEYDGRRWFRLDFDDGPSTSER